MFLIMLFGLLHAYCLQRDERMKHLAAVGSAQAVADHMLTAILALCGFGAWAIVLPKVLTVPIWLLGVRHNSPWMRNTEAGFAPAGALLKFSMPVLGAELLSVFRDQLDKLIVSLVLGIEALGLYYFAFNAGLGASTALNRAFSNAVYPNLCAAADKLRAFRKAVLGLGLPLSLAYCVQAAAALVYVPVVFGADWAPAAPLVALLCLGGPARLLVDGARMHARAEGRSGQEFRIALGLSASVLAPFAFAARWAKTAEAYQLRYLARRCVRMGDGAMAWSLMKDALKANADILWQEPAKSLTTLGAAAVLRFLPSSFNAPLQAAIQRG
ncbi:MAG: oligosaccharide flippase family protein [Pseudomonadota bacterium]